MNQIALKIAIYNKMTYPLTWYRNKYVPPFEHVGWPPEKWVRDYDEASDLIYGYLSGNKPCVIGRYGCVWRIL